MKAIFLDKYYSFISISGKGVKNFLNGQFSCNIKNLQIEKPIRGAYIDVSGRISCTFNIFKFRPFLKARLVRLSQFRQFGVHSIWPSTVSPCKVHFVTL